MHDLISCDAFWFVDFGYIPHVMYNCIYNRIIYSRTPAYGHLTKPVTLPLWSPWLSPKLFSTVKNRTLVPVIRSPPYSGIRSVIPSQVAQSPLYNGQSWPSSGSWLQIQLPPGAAGRTAAPAEHKDMITKGNQHLLASYKDRFTSATIK